MPHPYASLPAYCFWRRSISSIAADDVDPVVKGRFRMEFRDRQVWLEEGEFLIVPRGVEHRPVAEEEAHVLLFEPATTLNTGNVQNERTIAKLERI